MEKAGDILKKIFDENISIKNNVNFNIFRDWEFIIGKKIYGHSRIIDIINHILLIEVDHPGWLQIMIMKEKEILKKIRQKYPELEIKFIKYQMIYKPIKRDDKIEIKENIKIDNQYTNNNQIENIKHLELKNLLNKLYNCILNNQSRVDKNE